MLVPGSTRLTQNIRGRTRKAKPILTLRQVIVDRSRTCHAPPMPVRSTLRIGDFALRDGRVILVETGNSAPVDRALVAEVAIWVACYLAVRLCALRHLGRRRPAILFTPRVPHPRYMVRIAAIWAGIGIARDAAAADAAFYFDDATSAVPPTPPHARALNFACTDIRKSRVAAVFADVFGYPLAVDPATWHGNAVEKSEANGTHDGRIVTCPRRARPGFVYQRVVGNTGGGVSTDLRTHVVGGRVVAVWVKCRAEAHRFEPANLSAALHTPEAIFTAVEIAAIEAFAAAMGADWAGLDILRDAATGRIYVVDVNKTDAGPIIALPLAAKLRSIALLARALTALVTAPAVAQTSSAVASASIRASRAA